MSLVAEKQLPTLTSSPVAGCEPSIAAPSTRSGPSARTLRRAAVAASVAGAPPPPTPPSLSASASSSSAPWLQVSPDGSCYEPASPAYAPSALPLASQAPSNCSLCGVAVKSGLPMCKHWRTMHSHALCTQGYSVCGGFPSAQAAEAWLDELLAPLGCRLSRRGGDLTRSSRGYILTLRCACLMVGDREIEASRSSLALATAAASSRAASASKAASRVAITTDVASSLLQARSLGGAGAQLGTRTVLCCHASGRVSDGGTGTFSAEYFHLHSHPMAPHHALPLRRPGSC